MPVAQGISSRRAGPACCLPVAEFEAKLTSAVDHLITERHRYSVAARRSVLGRTWPAICDELLDHYDAVQGARRLRAA